MRNGVKVRLDIALVARGLADSRARAKALVEAGVVVVGDVPATRPSAQISDEDEIRLTGDPMPWVSRAALKLIHGLDHFAISPKGAICLDLGASTGGFTEVLLARGAEAVTAVDVGHGQLHPRLADDPRVTSHEGLNARDLTGLGPFDLLVADLSFISLTKALPRALAMTGPTAKLVVLVKPQFELGPSAVGKGGIVRDASLRQQAVETVERFLVDAGWEGLGHTESPITGSDGNVEFLMAARR